MRTNNHKRWNKGGNRAAALTLTAAAVALAAPPAQALDLNIYGVGHLSADAVDDGTDSGTAVASNSSRLGFRGGHDLGDGLRAIFQYEAGVDLTGQGGNDGNGPGSTNDIFTNARDSYVGFSGGFGTFVAGKLGGLNQWLYDYNLFADQVGDLGNIWGGSGLPGRVTSAAHYRTPDLNGLSVGFSFVPDEDFTRSEDAYVVKADYAGGPLRLGAAYAQLNQDAGDDWKVTAITASYDLGGVTVGGGWQGESDMGGVAGNDRDSLTLGASAEVGNDDTFKVQYANSDADTADSDAEQWAIGYDHAVNEYTTIYAAYAATENDPAAAFTANNYGHGDAVTPTAGADPSVFSVGVVVKFDAGIWPR